MLKKPDRQRVDTPIKGLFATNFLGGFSSVKNVGLRGENREKSFEKKDFKHTLKREYPQQVFSIKCIISDNCLQNKLYTYACEFCHFCTE